MGTFNPIPFGDISSRKGVQAGIAGQSANLAGQQGIAGKQRGSEFGTLMPGYSSLLDSGYSPQEKSQINQSTLGGISSAYGGAADSAARRMARTNNSAGYSSFLGANARGKAGDLASQNLKNQSAFADEALRRKMAGLEGIASLYGVDTSFLNSLNQGRNQLVNTAAGVYSGLKSRPGFWSSFGQGLGTGLGNLASGGGGKG